MKASRKEIKAKRKETKATHREMKIENRFIQRITADYGIPRTLNLKFLRFSAIEADPLSGQAATIPRNSDLRKQLSTPSATVALPSAARSPATISPPMPGVPPRRRRRPCPGRRTGTQQGDPIATDNLPALSAGRGSGIRRGLFQAAVDKRAPHVTVGGPAGLPAEAKPTAAGGGDRIGRTAMAYKDILVYLDPSAETAERLRSAINLAKI